MNHNLENGKISISQLKFSIIYYLQASILITGFYIGITKQDSWIIIISGALISMPFIGIYIYLTNQFPGKNLVQINELVFGKITGKIFSVMYLIYFLSIAAFNLRDLGNFAVLVLIPETPVPIVLVSFIFICAWAVYEGIEILVRYSMVFTYLWIIIILSTIILLMPKLDLKNFLPVFTFPFSAYLQGSHISAAISVNDLVVFMFILPCVREKKLIKKTFFSGIFFGIVFLLIIILRDIAVLNNFNSTFFMPTYESLRLINVSEIFNRMEIILSILSLIVMFFKISVLYYAVVICIAQIFELQSYKPIVFVTGALIISFALIVFVSPMENSIWGRQTAPFFLSFSQALLPLITFLTFMIRKRINKIKNNTKSNI